MASFDTGTQLCLQATCSPFSADFAPDTGHHHTVPRQGPFGPDLSLCPSLIHGTGCTQKGDQVFRILLTVVVRHKDGRVLLIVDSAVA